MSIKACFWPCVIFNVFLPGLAIGVLAGDFVATIFGGAGKFDIALSDDDEFLFLVRAGAIDSEESIKSSGDVLSEE